MLAFLYLVFERLSHPYGVLVCLWLDPVVYASLRPPATLCEPSGLSDRDAGVFWFDRWSTIRFDHRLLSSNPPGSGRTSRGLETFFWLGKSALFVLISACSKTAKVLPS